PIVNIQKSNGSLRVCGDYKRTLNPHIFVDQYPLPRTEELLAKLNGGLRYSKIDLRQAYNQLVMDEESKEYLVINTPIGLLAPERLQYGVNSASAIFQREMDRLFGDIPNCGVFQDDVIITGKTNREHLDALEKVFKIIKESKMAMDERGAEIISRMQRCLEFRSGFDSF